MSVQEQALQKLQEKILQRQEKQAEHIRTTYPHALVNTLTFDETVNKCKVQIKCSICGDTSRWVYTSDLFQVHTCTACANKAKAAIKAAKKEMLAKAMALVKGGAVAPKAPELVSVNETGEEVEETENNV